MAVDNKSWLDEINWDENGLVPVIAQDNQTGKILTLAWMNRDALSMTVNEGKAVYWSRTRHKIWIKGETSGYVQWIEEIRTDCDKDTLLLLVKQEGGIACHTGRQSCFFSRLDKSGWEDVDPVLKDPKIIYKSTS